MLISLQKNAVNWQSPIIVTAAVNDGRVVSTPPSASRDDGVPCVRLASRLTTFVSCSVHVGASRHIHYPSLNACLIHQGRSPSFQCRTVHFGYAIPVIIHRHSNTGAANSCEIVLDSHATLEPATASYLLEQHPDLVAIGANLRNPTLSPTPDGRQAVIQAAKLAAFKSVEVRTHHRSGSQTPLIQSDVSSSNKMAVDPNELYDQLMRQNSAEQDIQAIAKQISDHAEAIYQTWKSKGLTPNELLHLHSTESESPVDLTTTPAFRQMRSSSVDRRNSTERPKSGSSLSPVELLASPQLDATLEQLVNSFVHEDKARLAARARTVSPSPVGMQQPTAASTIQTALKRFEMKGLNYESARASNRQSEPLMDVTVRSSPSFQEAVQSTNRTSAGQAEPTGTVRSRAQRFATRIELANASHVSPSWPVKRAVSPGPVQYHKVTVVAEVAAHNPVAVTIPASNTSEVDKEEEKLINALKTGRIIDEIAVPNSPTSSDHFHQSMIKKSRQRRSVPAARAGNAEEELESLVGRLKITEPTPKSAASVSRESSPGPITLGIRDGSPARSTSPRSVKLSETVPVAGVSTVDYAKVRYQAAQANPLTQQRLDDSRNIGKAQNTPQPNVVSETRSRFEGSIHSTRPAVNTCALPWRSGVQVNEWSPVRSPASVDPGDELQAAGQQPQSAGNSGLSLEALRRMKTRKMRKSPEPQPTGTGSNTSPTSSPLPHPELTVQQKQHLRERNLQQQGAGGHHATSVGLPVQYTSTGIPIRPFLTRGSVAERVLIFEKCPTTVVMDSASKSDKVTSTVIVPTAEKSKRAGSPAPQPWRHSNEVQTRVQVS